MLEMKLHGRTASREWLDPAAERRMTAPVVFPTAGRSFPESSTLTSSDTLSLSAPQSRMFFRRPSKPGSRFLIPSKACARRDVSSCDVTTHALRIDKIGISRAQFEARLSCLTSSTSWTNRFFAATSCFFVDICTLSTNMSQVQDRHAGCWKILLWTNDMLVGARRIYQATGLTLPQEEHHHSFGHDLTGQVWMGDL